MLDTNNLDSLISISITLNVRINALSLSLIYSSPDQSSGQPVNGYDYRAGYRIKIKLIYGLKKGPNQALISISTILEFPAQVTKIYKIVFMKVL